MSRSTTPPQIADRSRPSLLSMLEPLEPRALLSHAPPTPQEQYLVELINRARANPAAEAAAFGIDLNEGLPAGTISAAAKQPLAIDLNMTDAARGHSQWMLQNDTFSHTGAGGSNGKQRMQSAGYRFTGSWAWGENIAWRGNVYRTLDATDAVSGENADLFIDTTETDRGHRTNELNPTFRQIGVGSLSGSFVQGGTSYNAVMTTEEFASSYASSGGNPFLTGVAYSDAVKPDLFYTPGEGLGGITIIATRGGKKYRTTSWSSGGYSLAVPPGTYTVTASGPGLPGVVTYRSVKVGSLNLKLDFTPAMASAATPRKVKKGKSAAHRVAAQTQPSATPRDLLG